MPESLLVDSPVGPPVLRQARGRIVGLDRAGAGRAAELRREAVAAGRDSALGGEDLVPPTGGLEAERGRHGVLAERARGHPGAAGLGGQPRHFFEHQSSLVG